MYFVWNLGSLSMFPALVRSDRRNHRAIESMVHRTIEELTEKATGLMPHFESNSLQEVECDVDGKLKNSKSEERGDPHSATSVTYLLLHRLHL